MGWTNVLVILEPVYPNLVRVFYSNMIFSSNTTSRIFTNVAGIHLEFDVEDLNMILRTQNEGFLVYTSRSRIDHPWYSVVDVVQNICRRDDLSK